MCCCGALIIAFALLVTGQAVTALAVFFILGAIAYIVDALLGTEL